MLATQDYFVVMMFVYCNLNVAAVVMMVTDGNSNCLVVVLNVGCNWKPGKIFDR